MIKIKVERDDIWITTQDGIVFEMNWVQMKDLEKALATLSKLVQAAPFETVTINLP